MRFFRIDPADQVRIPASRDLGLPSSKAIGRFGMKPGELTIGMGHKEYTVQAPATSGESIPRYLGGDQPVVTTKLIP